MKRQLAVVLVLWLLTTGIAFAQPDGVSSWVNIGQYRLVLLDEADPRPLLGAGGQPYPATGLYPADGALQPIWKAAEPIKGDEFFVTQDGRRLAVVSQWGAQGVKLYEEGRVSHEFAPADFGATPDPARKWARELVFDTKTDTLRVVTEQLGAYDVSLQTGALTQIAAAETAAPTRGLTWELPLALGLLALFYVWRRRRR